MSNSIQAYAATKPGSELTPISYDPGPLARDQVEISVHYCGICHSDLSMINNEWGFSSYPLVAGHEVAGVVAAVGEDVRSLKVGDAVGLGWSSGSCMNCASCLSGNHNLCARGEGTIMGRHGGFADRVRCREPWAIPLPGGLDLAKVGPLLCGGATVFNPLVQYNVRPTDRVGVVGIGGLGHMALKFLNKWGCEVTAFSSSPGKADEARAFGAHHVVDSRDSNALHAIAGSLDFILVTSNVPLDWNGYLTALAPKGRLHVVGAVLEPMQIPVFSLLMGQKSVSSSPVGSPAVERMMLEFCARHGIAPTTEQFPLSQVNEALEHLRSGKARYRIVLKRDF